MNGTVYHTALPELLRKRLWFSLTFYFDRFLPDCYSCINCCLHRAQWLSSLWHSRQLYHSAMQCHVIWREEFTNSHVSQHVAFTWWSRNLTQTPHWQSVMSSHLIGQRWRMRRCHDDDREYKYECHATAAAAALLECAGHPRTSEIATDARKVMRLHGTTSLSTCTTALSAHWTATR